MVTFMLPVLAIWIRFPSRPLIPSSRTVASPERRFHVPGLKVVHAVSVVKSTSFGVRIVGERLIGHGIQTGWDQIGQDESANSKYRVQQEGEDGWRSIVARRNVSLKETLESG